MDRFMKQSLVDEDDKRNNKFLCIRKTCPYNEYPLKPQFYIVKLGYAGVYLFFLVLFLLQNIDCGYSLNRLAEVVLTCAHNQCFEKI